MLLLSLAMAPFVDPAGEQGLVPETWPPPRAGAFATNAFVVIAIAPTIEELTFRGLFSLLRFGSRVAIVGTALVHAGARPGRGAPQIFALGLGLAYLRHRLNSVYPASSCTRASTRSRSRSPP